MPRFVLLVVLILLAACSQYAGKSPQEAFEEFYKRFHEDTDYQIAHITFPLEGLPSHADVETITTNDFKWEKEDWEVHRPFNFENSDFVREVIPFGDDLMVEKIIHKSGEYGTIRRFARLGEEWYLIYYAGLNRIEQ